MKNFFRNFVFLFAAVATLTISSMNMSFALVDNALKQNYSVKTMGDGSYRFTSSLPGIRIMPWFDGTPGDLSIELGNPFCLAYLISYYAAMNAGNAAVKATATAALVVGVSTIYGVAAQKNKDFEICGADWLVWGSSNSAGSSALSNIIEHYPEMGAFNGSKKYDVVQCTKSFNYCVKLCSNRDNCLKYYNDDAKNNYVNYTYKQLETCLLENPCLLDLKFIAKDGARNYLNMHDKVFRERFYDGEEVANRECYDPREDAKLYDVNADRVAAGKVPYQHYYMRGAMPGNYACNRFSLERQEDGDKFDEAYNCCVEASNSVCIMDKMTADIESRDRRAKFCSADTGKCTMDAFIFEIFPSKLGEPNKFCAKTWSLCPYNFNIQKGSEQTLSFDKTVTKTKQKVKQSDGKEKEEEVITVTDECYDYTNDVSYSCQNRRKNFYQYDRHCTVVQKWVPQPVDENSYPPFIDKSCINFVGSSHNTVGYTTYKGYDKMFDRYKSFTAPIAECITETLKNFLFNRAGHTKCVASAANPNARPDMYGKCNNAEGAKYTEGESLLDVQGLQSPAVRLLSYIRTLIMLAVTLMISLYGYGILIKGGQMNRKDMMIAFLKVVIVVTFSASGWWYDQLFRFTYGFSNTFSTMTAKIGFENTMDSEGNFIKYDGCYFGNINDILGKQIGDIVPNIGENNYYNYPANRRYIAFFDSLDCKIVRYLGYGIGINAPSLITFLGATFIWPFNIGIYLGVATLMMALFVINFAIKAVYIFIASAIGIALMLYVSPLIIPCILFKKTEGIFKSWMKNTISFCLQPMVLFAFVGMSLTIMDKYVLGEAMYGGSGLNKELICGYSCVDAETGSILNYTSERGGNIVTEFSTACGSNEIIDLKRNSLACFLDKMTTSPWAMLQPLGLFVSIVQDLHLSDVIMFLRVAFLFFILTKVLGTVPGIASNLTGGRDLPSTAKGDPFVGAKKLTEFIETVKRGVGGAAQKLAKDLKPKGKDKGGDDKDGGGEGGATDKRSELTGVEARPKGGSDK